MFSSFGIGGCIAGFFMFTKEYLLDIPVSRYVA